MGEMESQGDAWGQGTVVWRADTADGLSPLLSTLGVSPSEKPVVMLPNQAGASPCAADEVACDTGDCIAAELACDFADTCTDGSDEKHCGESQGRHLHQHASSGGDQALLGWHGQGT